jgi:phosphatidylinositol kinase/protein kinase (PI-3  family)
MWTVQTNMQGETTKTARRQTDSLPEAEADRAIQTVKRKLSSRLSAEADVRRLILEATDEGNLSRMYCGMTTIFYSAS